MRPNRNVLVNIYFKFPKRESRNNLCFFLTALNYAKNFFFKVSLFYYFKIWLKDTSFLSLTLGECSANKKI